MCILFYIGQDQIVVQAFNNSNICPMYIFPFLQFYLQLLCLIGEAFGDYSAELCGAVVSIRNKGDRVGVWTANPTNVEGTLHIGYEDMIVMLCI